MSQAKSASEAATSKSADQNDQPDYTPDWPNFDQEAQDYYDEGFSFAHDPNR